MSYSRFGWPTDRNFADANVSSNLVYLVPPNGAELSGGRSQLWLCGFALGATPTAIANMTAVTKSHGPASLAFIILPLVAAFFVDIANSFLIKFALGF